MGIKNLRKVIKPSMKEVPVGELNGKRVGIDASLSIYQLHLGGVESSHIRGTFHRIAAFRKLGITPVYFFDGAPPHLKEAVCKERKKRVEEGKGIKIPDGTFDDVRRLLQLMKIEYIDAPGEAEAQAAHATVHNYIDMIATEDIDALPFGALKQCLGLKANAKKVTIIMLAEVLAELNISRESFIDLCLLLGSDYTVSTINGVGPVKALKYIREYGSIEKILEHLKIKPDKGFCYKAARAEFMAPNVNPDYPPKNPNLLYTEEELDAIKELLKSKNVNVDVSKLK